jgi:hypothetical protein
MFCFRKNKEIASLGRGVKDWSELFEPKIVKGRHQNFSKISPYARSSFRDLFLIAKRQQELLKKRIVK